MTNIDHAVTVSPLSGAASSVTFPAAPPTERDEAIMAQADSREWPAYLQDVCELLWPPPDRVTLDGIGSGSQQPFAGPASHAPRRHREHEFMLISGPGRPPLLVPTVPRLAASAVRHFSRSGSLSARLAIRALSAGLASGLGTSVIRGRIRVAEAPQPDNIESYLRNVMSRELRVSMFIGRPRANRKPVLQLLSPTGEPVGYVKIGINSLTRDLVRTEHDALVRLGRADLTEIKVAPVLHYGQWHGLDVLVLGALPAWQRSRPAPAARLVAAMSEIARVDGLRRAELASSTYLRQLRLRLADADAGANRTALQHALDSLAERAGDTVLSYGAWHGDWSPWNMATTQGGMLVWDWERYDPDAPLGFDALHHWMQVQIGPGHGDPLTTASACIEHAALVTAPFGIEAPQARLTAALYLADLSVRYLVDRQAKAGARHGDPGEWLIPALASEVARLPLGVAR
jgi:hypothetical protein